MQYVARKKNFFEVCSHGFNFPGVMHQPEKEALPNVLEIYCVGEHENDWVNDRPYLETAKRRI